MTKKRRRNRQIHGLGPMEKVQKNNEDVSRESNAALIRKHRIEKAEYHRISQALLWQIKVIGRALEIMGRSAKYEVHEYVQRAEKEINDEG